MISLVFSCEAATCAIPEQHRALFAGDIERLTSAEGWEPGSLNLAQGMAMKFRTPLCDAHVSRLLIDLSRRADDPRRWSDIAATLPVQQRDQLHDRQFLPHLNLLRQRIGDALKRNPQVLHVSVRTHQAVHGGPIPIPDIGLIYQPLRSAERSLAEAWLNHLRNGAPDLRITANEPDSGDHFGLLHQLREEFPDPSYAALTLTASQSLFLEGSPWRWDKAKKLILDSFAELTEETVPR
jgi:predicted N-formylglutamate amidohydrolase